MKELFFGKYAKGLVASVVAMVVGFAAWMYILNVGLLETTNLSNLYTWGLAIAVFAFLVGFGAGAQILASYIVLSGRPELKPFALVAQAIALAGGCGAGVAIITDLGSPWNMLQMLLHPNLSSPMVWDMAALSAFLVVAVVLLVALAREWKSLRVWAALGLVAALALQVVEGLLFATQTARAYWASVVMPVDFLAVAVVCGAAILTLIAALAKSVDGNLTAARAFGKILAIAVCVHLVLALIEIGHLVVENTAAGNGALGSVLSYLPLYLAELLLPLAAAVVLFIKRDRADAKILTVSAVLVILGMFCHRMMLMAGAFGGSTLYTSLSNMDSASWAYPVATGLYSTTGVTFQLTQMYAPAPIEWLSVLLPIGLTCALVILALNVTTALAKR